MRVLGLTITRTKGLALQPLSGRGSWWPMVRESFTGAWQKNLEITTEDVLTHSTVWACVTLIASDISKLWVNLVERDDHGIWTTTENPAYSPVLRKPNHYQNRIKFFEYWILSKLIRGNTYALKVRDNRRVVTALHVLDSSLVLPLVAPDGGVYYQIGQDALSGIDEDSETTVPASEIIHDVGVPLYHPLVGVSPIYACGMAALQGLKIQSNSTALFANGSQPGGVLTAPGVISTETAQRLQAYWEANYAGEHNIGKVAVLGDGLKYEPMTMSASDAQLIDQLKWSDERVCSCFHVPPYKVGVGPIPPYGNVQAANIEYYSQALQGLIENLELCLDEGLGTGKDLGAEFDLDALLRMDSATQMDIAVKGVGGAVYTPNEARAKFDLMPVTGGDTPYLQEQNWPLAHLSSRPLPTRPITPPKDEPMPDEDDVQELAAAIARKALTEGLFYAA